MISNNKRTILVVDDAQPLRKVLNEWLTNANYTVIEAKNGKEGVAMYKKYMPDLVLMDINMPKLNGVEALQQIVSYNLEACVIMISREDDYEIIDDCKGYGAIEYIIKPFSIDVLLQAIHVALN